jgi:glycosyltransferase involved in cell wall biosynthesis
MTEPIRVLQVMGLMNRGGAETMVMNLYRVIDKSKIQFDFVVHNSGEGAYDREITELGGRIFKAPKYNGKNHFIYKNWWNLFFKEHPEYKVIHSHIRSTAAIILKIAKKYGCTTIVHSHSTSSGCGISALVKNLYQCPIRYISDYFMGCSQVAGEWLFGKKICSTDRYINMRNAIDTSKYVYDKSVAHEVRSEFNYLNSDFVIGHVGRFSEPKNHMFLLEIFKELHDKDSNCKLLLVGDGELRSKIEGKICELGLNNCVKLAGSRSDVNRVLMAMDLFLFPSLWEGLPVSVVEAQASGLPCVVSSSVTNEVCLSELVTSISLSDDEMIWCDKIFKMIVEIKKSERHNMQETIVNAGYDVFETSKWLSDFYKKCYNEAI